MEVKNNASRLPWGDIFLTYSLLWENLIESIETELDAVEKKYNADSESLLYAENELESLEPDVSSIGTAVKLIMPVALIAVSIAVYFIVGIYTAITVFIVLTAALIIYNCRGNATQANADSKTVVEKRAFLNEKCGELRASLNLSEQRRKLLENECEYARDSLKEARGILNELNRGDARSDNGNSSQFADSATLNLNSSDFAELTEMLRRRQKEDIIKMRTELGAK